MAKKVLVTLTDDLYDKIKAIADVYNFSLSMTIRLILQGVIEIKPEKPKIAKK